MSVYTLYISVLQPVAHSVHYHSKITVQYNYTATVGNITYTALTMNNLSNLVYLLQVTSSEVQRTEIMRQNRKNRQKSRGKTLVF
jgi:hypothetical protein